MEYINVERFLKLMVANPAIDVRSPAEFHQGHIPGAFNIPLFNDEERKIVGTIYKQSGKDAAILRGLEIAGPKMAGFIKALKKISKNEMVLVHCWRGGMRSRNIAWLFESAGYEVKVLTGGYKAYRNFVRNAWTENREYIVLGGRTGSGKSEVLNSLQKAGEQVLDLEGIAHHKGSAFGDLGQPDQPSNEQFENNLHQAWQHFDKNKMIWVEDESRGIGRVSIPDLLFEKIRSAPVLFLDVSKEERIERLVHEYATFDPGKLEAAIHRIAKKLGGLNEKKSVEALQSGDFNTVVDLLLTYYDKAYLAGLGLRDEQLVYHLEFTHHQDQNIAELLNESMDDYFRSKSLQNQIQ